MWQNFARKIIGLNVKHTPEILVVFIAPVQRLMFCSQLETVEFTIDLKQILLKISPSLLFL